MLCLPRVRLNYVLVIKYSNLTTRFRSNVAANAITSSLSAETAVDRSTRVYAWGLMEHGALGLANGRNENLRKFRYKHKPTRHYFGEENNVVAVDCGFGFTLLARKSFDLFKVFGCGVNTDSQIGYHDPHTGHPLGLLVAPAPINLPFVDCATEILSVSAGRAHAVVVTDREGVFTLGSNCYGQCGRPIINEEKYCASNYIHQILYLDDKKVVDAVCGQDHTLFLTEEGKVYACGWGADGQVGVGHNDNVSVPTPVTGPIENEIVTKLSSKSDTVLALTINGLVYGWGNTEYYQFTCKGDGRQSLNTSVIVDKLKYCGKIVDIAAGGSICMVLNEEGDVYVWGYGILGCGPKVLSSDVPLKIPRTLFGCNAFQPDVKVTSIACGLAHMAAINNYGTLFTWGRNRYGCLGIGHVRDQYFPYKVCLASCIDFVACGVDHTFALGKPFA